MMRTAAPFDVLGAEAVTASPQQQPAGTEAERRPDEPSLGELVSQASAHLSTLVRSELELAKLELRSSVKNAGVGLGMFAAAGVVLVFSLTFGFFALAEGLAAAGLYRWLAFLVVFALLLVVVGLLAFVGIRQVKRVRAPRRTIETSKQTVAYLRDHTPHG
jgi:uncharacterized membrane protein YqjE